jgi:alpha-L-rhamnosidase
MKSDSSPFNARWIASHIVGGPQTSAPAPYLKRDFTLEPPLERATLRITALGLYECHLNGRRVGRDVLAPGWTDYRKRVAFQQHDVTALLQSGANRIGVILGDGWYCGFMNECPRQLNGDRPELLAELSLLFKDGSHRIIGSDAEWESRAGPILANDIFKGESYDARLESADWDQPGGSPGGWLPVEVRADKAIEIHPSAAPPIREQEQLPARLLETRKDRRIYDMGQNFSGVVRLRVAAPAGRHLVLRHGEMLRPDGTVYTDNLRTARSTDLYTCKGHPDGEQWQPRFTFHGFRYVEVSGLGKEDTCELTGIVLNSDMEETGAFSCSHPLLNQLWKNIRWGMKSNFLDVPTDCPQRDERMGWTGDAQVFCRTAASFMDVRGFFEKWLLDVRDAQSPDGSIPRVVPNVGNYEIDYDSGPGWADAVVICPWTLYLCYGDKGFLEDNYPAMKGYMDFCAAHRVRDSIRNHPDIGGYCFGDWLNLETDAHTSPDLIGTAYYALNAGIMEKSARLLGKADEADQWAQLRATVTGAFQRRFLTADGLVIGGTQTAYVLALAFDLVPADLRPRTVAELLRLIRKTDTHIATGFIGTPYILDALENGGCLDVAYALLEQETFPSWLFPVTQGATTIWERWDGWHPERGFQDTRMNSFNHYAYGAVGSWMMRSVAGIDLDEAQPGGGRILFRPRPGGSLTHASASLRTPHGTAAIEWRRDGSRTQATLTVPESATGRFSPPPGSGLEAVDALGPGRHDFSW